LLNSFDRRYFLTSRMFSYDLIDVYSTMYLLDQGKSFDMTFWEFRNKYFHNVGQYNYAPHSSTKDKLIKTIHGSVGTIYRDFETEEWIQGEL